MSLWRCTLARPARWRLFVAIALLALVGVTAAILMWPHSEPEINPPAGDTLTEEPGEDTTSAEGTQSAETSASASTLTITTEVKPPASATKKSKPGTPATPTGPGLTAQQQYLRDTKAVVDGNKSSLTAVAAAITTAMSNRDAAGLTSYLAPDEGSQTAYINALAKKYPTVLTSAPAATVNIFSTGTTTVYMAYCLVTWTDAGIVSQHTIPIPLRYVNGQWRLTSTFDNTATIQFVQAVNV